jgi:hypothetical protein
MFLYILTLIIIGLLLFFGIKWMKDINQMSTVVDATKFKKDIETAFDSMRSQYMSSKTYSFTLPDGVEQVCFVDSATVPGIQGVCDPTKDYFNDYICGVWKDGGTGIIIDPPLKTSTLSIGNIQVQEDPKNICFDITKAKRITVKLIGLGDMVRVKEP